MFHLRYYYFITYNILNLLILLLLCYSCLETKKHLGGSARKGGSFILQMWLAKQFCYLKDDFIAEQFLLILWLIGALDITQAAQI